MPREKGQTLAVRRDQMLRYLAMYGFHKRAFTLEVMLRKAAVLPVFGLYLGVGEEYLATEEGKEGIAYPIWKLKSYYYRKSANLAYMFYQILLGQPDHLLYFSYSVRGDHQEEERLRA